MAADGFVDFRAEQPSRRGRQAQERKYDPDTCRPSP